MKVFTTVAAVLSLAGIAVSQTPLGALASTVSSLQAALPTCGTNCFVAAANSAGCPSNIGASTLAATACNCNNYGAIAMAANANGCVSNACSPAEIGLLTTLTNQICLNVYTAGIPSCPIACYAAAASKQGCGDYKNQACTCPTANEAAILAAASSCFATCNSTDVTAALSSGKAACSVYRVAAAGLPSPSSSIRPSTRPTPVPTTSATTRRTSVTTRTSSGRTSLSSRSSTTTTRRSSATTTTSRASSKTTPTTTRTPQPRTTSASSSTKVITTVVNVFVTICAQPTTFYVGGVCYSATTPGQAVTVTNCPCTVEASCTPDVIGTATAYVTGNLVTTVTQVGAATVTAAIGKATAGVGSSTGYVQVNSGMKMAGISGLLAIVPFIAAVAL